MIPSRAIRSLFQCSRACRAPSSGERRRRARARTIRGTAGRMVPKGGLEPPRVAPHAPQTCASASSATSARGWSIASSRAADNSPGALAEPRVERVADALTEQVVREHGDEDGDAGIGREPPADLDRVLALVQNVAPAGVWRLDAESEERQPRLGEDRRRDP